MKKELEELVVEIDEIRTKVEQLMRSAVATDFQRECCGMALNFMARAAVELEDASK